MEHIADSIKSILLAVGTALLAIWTQFEVAFVALIAGFTWNFLMGMIADAATAVRSGKKFSFSLKKAGEGFLLLMIFVITIFAIYYMARVNEGLPVTLITYLTYIASYFYLTNGFKNASIALPKEKSLRFIYDVLSTEGFFKLKYSLGLKIKNSHDDRPEQ